MRNNVHREITQLSPEDSFLVYERVKDDFDFPIHFHPEYELVFIEGADGNRHVGNHFSRFKGSDLVLIGSYIPHLNFDYGIRTPYEKIVVHIQPEFLKKGFDTTPELIAIHELLTLSKQGIAFGKETQEQIGTRLKNLAALNKFEQFLELLDILNFLSEADDKLLLHSEPVKNQFNTRDKDRLDKIYAFIDPAPQVPVFARRGNFSFAVYFECHIDFCFGIVQFPFVKENLCFCYFALWHILCHDYRGRYQYNTNKNELFHIY